MLFKGIKPLLGKQPAVHSDNSREFCNALAISSVCVSWKRRGFLQPRRAVQKGNITQQLAGPVLCFI